jgi:hypothetical protein
MSAADGDYSYCMKTGQDGLGELEGSDQSTIVCAQVLR